MHTTTSLKRKKKRKLLRKSRETENNNLPINCLSCDKDLFSSIHHFFCDRCWKRIRADLNQLGDNGSAKWCLICGKNITKSPYAYVCETHGKKIEHYKGTTLAKKKSIANKGTENVPFNFDFCPPKR